MFPKLNFLTHPGDSGYNYRPAIVVTPQGELKVVFESRRGKDQYNFLYAFPLSDPDAARYFLKAPSSAPGGQTRPDCHWGTGRILFNAGADIGVYTVDCDGADAQRIEGTHHCYYPTWLPDAGHFVAENGAGMPSPCTTLFDINGTIVAQNLNGIWVADSPDVADLAVYGGMPAVNPHDASAIAFAGEPIIRGQYNQEENYIFLTRGRDEAGVYHSVPMERGVTGPGYQRSFQGRAPAWSPDGKTIAFESNRSGQYAIYLYDLARGRVTQVTDNTAYCAQHAKFFPDGQSLILCATDLARKDGWQIGRVDIRGLL